MMNVVLWLTQIVLALGFGASAVMKGTWDRERLVRAGQTGVQGLPVPLIRTIAVVELLGAVGLLAPWASGVAPYLTPVAALGLAVIMVLAAGVHIILREPKNVLIPTLICAACCFVAYGRGMRLTWQG